MTTQLEYAQEEIRRQRDLYDRKCGRLILGANYVKDMKTEDPDFFERNYIQPLNFGEEMTKLIRKEVELELKIRRDAVKNYIAQQGLTKYSDGIIQGMNKSCRRVTLWDGNQETSPLILRLIAQHDSSALLEFAFNYVDRWKMYNELFGENSDDKSK